MRIFLGYTGKTGKMPLIQWAYPLFRFVQFSKQRRKTEITEHNSQGEKMELKSGREALD